MNPLNNFDLRSIDFNFMGKKAEEIMLLFLVCSEFNVSIKESEKNKFDDLKAGYASMKPELRWEYWQSWSISDHPDAGIKFLLDIGWLDLFPELNPTTAVFLNPETHPEGELINHIILCVGKAAEIANRELLSESDRSCLTFSALCHDLGKVYGENGHEKTGRDVCVRFMNSIGAPYNLTDVIQRLVFYHMADYSIDGIPTGSAYSISEQLVVHLRNMVNIPLLLLLHEADQDGRKRPKVGISDGFSAIKRIYEVLSSGDRSRFDNNPLKIMHVIQMVKSGILENDLLLIPGDSQTLFVDRANMAYRDGLISHDELFYLPAYAMSDKYNEALNYVLSLDYRDFSRLFDFAEKNNMDVDNFLFLGKSELEKKLNSP